MTENKEFIKPINIRTGEAFDIEPKKKRTRYKKDGLTKKEIDHRHYMKWHHRKTKVGQLEIAHAKLLIDYNELAKKYNKLTDQYNELASKYNSLLDNSKEMAILTKKVFENINV